MLATLLDSSLGWAYVEYLEAPDIKYIEELQQVTQEPSWIDQYIRYITESILPKEPKVAKLLKRRALHFMLLDG